jgi:AcrR family transcriptional regulator
MSTPGAGRAEAGDRPAWERRSLDRVGRQALQRSHKVIRAARELVALGGLEAVTLRPLLEKSGLSRRAFYDRFRGMDDVLLALFEETMAQGAAALAKRIAKVEGAPARLEALVRAMASGAQGRSRDRTYVLAMSSEHVRLAEQRPRDLLAATRPMSRLMAEILEAGMREGTIREADPERLADMLHAVVASEIHRSLHLDRRGKGWIDDLCHLCLRGIQRR